MFALSYTSALVAALAAGPKEEPRGLELAPPEFWAMRLGQLEEKFKAEVLFNNKCPGITLDLIKKFNPRVVEEQGLDDDTVEEAWDLMWPCWLAYLQRA